MLEQVDLTKSLSKDEYKKVLPKLQQRVFELQKACWEHRIPVAIVFEGWDAAGKGTSIITLTERLDPRGYKLHPIKAPRPDELNRPWLFRFWLCIPAYGEIAIFDRSWYGRVLVERVEGFTPEKQWRQGYQDIVDFERGLADDGTVIIKFWLHISKKEQKRRFKRLDADPLTSWHVTEEDWEHHRKYEEYLVAVEEMMQRTDTEWGPWTIVEATSRWYARRKILETVIFRLEERLGAEAPEPVSEAELQQDMDVRLEAELRLAMEEAEHETGDNSNGEA